MRHTCTNNLGTGSESRSNCYLQNGKLAEYGETEEYYEQCKNYDPCSGVLASVSFNNQKNCNQFERKCLNYQLKLSSCDPSKDLMIVKLNSKKSTISIQKYDDLLYLSYDPASNLPLWSTSEYLWNLSVSNQITRISNSDGYLSSVDGTNMSIVPIIYGGYWQSFQYLNLEFYNLILKSADCPCNGCFNVLSSWGRCNYQNSSAEVKPAWDSYHGWI